MKDRDGDDVGRDGGTDSTGSTGGTGGGLAEAGALRAALHAEADWLKIPHPPVLAVRRRAARRRVLRLTLQGVSGVAVSGALLTGLILWSPGGGTAGVPLPPGSSTATQAATPATTAPATPGSTPPAPGATSGAAPAATTPPAGYLLPADLGPDWRLAPAVLRDNTGLALAGSPCKETGQYKTQTAIRPAVNKEYVELLPSGKQVDMLLEAVYTFAPGTGSEVIDKVRTAIAGGCGKPDTVKLLAASSADADHDTLVFTVDGSTVNILVRDGDRIASALAVPAESSGGTPVDKGAWIATLVTHMAMRLAES